MNKVHLLITFSLNEAWENLVELIDTRSQILEASRQMHKFFYDCRDCLARILEKSHSLPEELGRGKQYNIKRHLNIWV